MEKKKFPVIPLLLAIFVVVLFFGIYYFRDSIVDFVTTEPEINYSDGNWWEIEIPIDDYENKVVFMMKAVEPYLAEYDYKLKIVSSEEKKEFDLDPNTGGWVYEPVYLINYEKNKYLQIRGDLFDLSKIERITPNYGEYEEVEGDIDDLKYNNVRVFGEWKFLGLLKSVENKVELLLEFEGNTPLHDITYTEWYDLLQNKGKIRFGLDKEAFSISHEGFIEVDNGDRKESFSVLTFFNTNFPIRFCNYKEKLYLSAGPMYEDFINVDNLLDLKTGQSTVTLNSGEGLKVKTQSLFVNDLLKGCKFEEIGSVDYIPSGAEFTAVE